LCSAICCNYLALEIDKPNSKKEFEYIRWYLLHENTHVFVESGKWYLQIWNKCTHLQPDNKCGIYETRPEICREYGTSDKGQVNCHAVSSENEEYDILFTEPEEVEAFYRNWHEKRYGKKKKKQKRKKS
jgi:Fe-S-cluster containining protein